MIWLTLLLAGEFVQDCRSSVVRGEFFHGNTAVYSETNHFDRGCHDPSLSLISYGTYVLGSAVEAPAGAVEIDFTFARVTLLPAAESVAQTYRSRKMCGLADWKRGEETEITGLHCDFFATGGGVAVPKAGDVRYGVVKISDDQLLFGDLTQERDAMAPDRRPLVLDEWPFRRRHAF